MREGDPRRIGENPRDGRRPLCGKVGTGEVAALADAVDRDAGQLASGDHGRLAGGVEEEEHGVLDGHERHPDEPHRVGTFTGGCGGLADPGLSLLGLGAGHARPVPLDEIGDHDGYFGFVAVGALADGPVPYLFLATTEHLYVFVRVRPVTFAGDLVLFTDFLAPLVVGAHVVV